MIRAIVRRGIEFHGFEIIGVRDGWKGLLELEVEPLTLDKVSGILYRGGTILGTSRTNPGKVENGYDIIRDNFVKLGLDGLIAIGGEDTLGVAYKLYEMGVPVVGVPKTIDNDLSATDLTFGFDTAVNVVMEAIDRLHTTAESHHRVMVVEVMGRHTGWIAVYGGLAGGADAILIPEEPFEIEEVCRMVQRRYEKGKRFSIIVVAEGACPKGVDKYFTRGGVDEFGHYRLGGVGEALAQEIERRTGFETRAISLGHIQRGGCPTAYDRILATRLGVAAVDLVAEGRFGEMPALKGNRIVPVPLKEAIGKLKTVDKEIYEVAKIFFS